MLNLYDLKTEYRKNPLGIDLESPKIFMEIEIRPERYSSEKLSDCSKI